MKYCPATFRFSFKNFLADFNGVFLLARLNPSLGGTEVCYDLKWTGVDVTMAHIHKGAAGTNGDPFAVLGPHAMARGTGVAVRAA